MAVTLEDVKNHIASGTVSELIKHTHASRIALFDPMARIFLSVLPEHIAENGRVDWNKVQPTDVETPVTLQDIEAWFKTSPHANVVSSFRQLFDTWRTESPTWSEVIRSCARISPMLIRAILPNTMELSNRQIQDMFEGFGEPVGRALATVATFYKNPSDGDFMARLTPEAVHAYLEGCEDVFAPINLYSLMRALPDELDLPHEAGEVYVDIMIAIKDHESLDQGSSYSYRIDQRWLDSEQIARIVVANKSNLERARWLMATLAFDGYPQAFDAFGELLGDDVLGNEALLYLGLGGTWGREVAERIVEDDSASELARTHAETLLSFEAPKHPESDRLLSPMLGHLVKHRRFGFTFASMLIDKEPGAPVAGTPTSFEELDALYQRKTKPELVQKQYYKKEQEAPSAQAWLDLLWITALEPGRYFSQESYDNALALGLLGREPSEDELLRVIEHLDWGKQINSSKKIGYGEALLGAGAGERVYLHAMATFAMTQHTNYLGYIENCFEEPAKKSALPWTNAIERLVWQHRYDKQNVYRALDTPTQFARAEGDGEVAIDAPGDVLFECHVDALVPSKITIRKDVTLEIDPEAGTFTFTGLSKEISGALPPMFGDGYTVQGELHKHRGIFGVNGIVIEGQQVEEIEVLAAHEKAPIKIATLGSNTTCRITLSEKYSETLGNHVLGLLRDLDDVQELAEIRAMQNPIAAYTLYLFSQLAPSDSMRSAAMHQLCELGELAEPYLGEVPEPRGPAPIEMVSFDTIIERMQALSDTPLHQGTEAAYTEQRWVGFEDVNLFPGDGDDEEQDYDDEEYEEDYDDYDGGYGEENYQVVSAVMLHEPFQEGREPSRPYWFDEDGARSMLGNFAGLSGNGMWYEARAFGEVYIDEDRDLILMNLTLEREGYEGWPIEGSAYLACWKCEDGWLFSSWGRSRSELQRVIGLDFWPTQMQWRAIEGWLGY